MTTVIRPEISMKNKYWIDKHRYYELKHFCLQYTTWKKAHAGLSDLYLKSVTFDEKIFGNTPSDLTGKYAAARAEYSSKIDIVEKAALDADKDLHAYILKAVTEDLSYSYLKTKMNIPCSKDTYYDRYRRFFWFLSRYRN